MYNLCTRGCHAAREPQFAHPCSFCHGKFWRVDVMRVLPLVARAVLLLRQLFTEQLSTNTPELFAWPLLRFRHASATRIDVFTQNNLFHAI